MRAMLADADLARYAGQFVWLELNYDKAENRAFLAQYGAYATPTFFVIDPHDGKVTAAQTGAMSLTEFTRFLDRGAGGVFAKRQAPADAALMQGDTLLAQKPEEAAKAYRKALQLAPAAWPRRELAEASLIAALRASRQWQECADTAAAEAAGMKRDGLFARVMTSGMWCVVMPMAMSDSPVPWARALAPRLEPLAREALSLPATVRDHRNELYRALMLLSLTRNDKKAAAKWGDRWLGELDAIKPINDQERSAIDIARVENIQVFGDPKRILPALIASERAMTGEWNASLRVAQMESAAGNYDEAVAACDRGLTRRPGPAGRSWLLQTKATALTQQGHGEEARRALKEALHAAGAIPNQRARENNLNKIRRALQRSAPADVQQKK